MRKTLEEVGLRLLDFFYYLWKTQVPNKMRFILILMREKIIKNASVAFVSSEMGWAR